MKNRKRDIQYRDNQEIIVYMFCNNIEIYLFLILYKMEHFLRRVISNNIIGNIYNSANINIC